ncbi:MAG: hypothetical protein GY865_20155 [candidate division Zixibacteria bacterium]|nr:hypothetical protein [candidate division Zixibacteria bacterium]
MDKKSKEDLDKCLQKFAVKGQGKLVGQLRQMLGSEQNKTLTEKQGIKKTSSKVNIGNKQLYVLMDSLRNEIKRQNQFEKKSANIYFEILCKPVIKSANIDPVNLKKAQQIISDCFACKSKFSLFKPEAGILYIRNITPESSKNYPNIFDPKVQAIVIADILKIIARFYQTIKLGFRDKIDIVFRYSDAVDLVVGSISPETFLPSVKYKEENLTHDFICELHTLLGQTADITAEIIIELLKQLRYQGIVNKNFFFHAISKHLARK